MSNYYYSQNYLNSKFNCNLTQDLSKDSICDAVEEQTGNETSFVTITNIDTESQTVDVDYRYWEFGDSEEESCILNLDDCY